MPSRKTPGKAVKEDPRCTSRIARVLGEQGSHGWIIAALLTDMENLEGYAAFDNFAGKFVEAPTLWLKLAKNVTAMDTDMDTTWRRPIDMYIHVDVDTVTWTVALTLTE